MFSGHASISKPPVPELPPALVAAPWPLGAPAAPPTDAAPPCDAPPVALPPREEPPCEAPPAALPPRDEPPCEAPPDEAPPDAPEPPVSLLPSPLVAGAALLPGSPASFTAPQASASAAADENTAMRANRGLHWGGRAGSGAADRLVEAEGAWDGREVMAGMGNSNQCATGRRRRRRISN